MAVPLWTEEERALLKAKWLKRERSAELIAEELSRELAREVTRNAVIGRLHRDGLLGKSKRPQQQKPRRMLWPVEPKVSPLREDLRMSERLPPFEWRSPQPGEGVALLELNARSCHWPIAAYAEVAVRFCGAPRQVGSYCALHAHYAFQCNARHR